MDEIISVIVRSYNDKEYIRRTMTMIFAQEIPEGVSLEVVNVDNESNDGTWEIIKELNREGVTYQIPQGEYIPGKVLNHAISKSTGTILVFNNSDCIPQNNQWLKNLVAPLMSDEDVSVTFGNQLSRKNAFPVVVKDNTRAFGDGKISAKWRHFFSLATSATKRSVWLEHSFREEMKYSEDIEWSWRLKQLGFSIQYVSDAIVEHSHNYTIAQVYKRFYGEGVAEGVIFGEKKRFLRDCFIPSVVEFLRDIKWLIVRGECRQIFYAAVYRPAQRWGVYRGSWDHFHGKGWEK